MMQVAHMFVDHVAKTEVVADRDRERASGHDTTFRTAPVDGFLSLPYKRCALSAGRVIARTYFECTLSGLGALRVKEIPVRDGQLGMSRHPRVVYYSWMNRKAMAESLGA